MCGIAGRFSPSATLPETAAKDVAAMTQRLLHRGPDGGGLLDRSPLGVLGHRRLAIIDIALGQQPMGSADGSLWVTFNGEIYNYQNLKARLGAKGHEFRTNSDTEVILAAYREWGDSCPEFLEGMFAFALLDAPKRKLFLARDHLGKKPLYIRWRSGVLDFASEVGALTESDDWRGDVDPVAMAFYLRLGYIPSPWTVYADVEKLRPGECCTVDANGVRKRRYWDPATAGRVEEARPDEILERIDATLKEAVKERLMSEVPLGAFLSGGIDSGLVVSLLAAVCGSGVKTVTVGFEGDPGELEAARRVAQRHQTDHREYVVQPRFQEIVERLPHHFGEPFADSSAIPTWYVSREAKRRVTVVLTGDGGDEPFGGYSFRYDPHRRDARLRRIVPRFLRRSLVRLLAAIWPRRHDLPRALRLSTALRNLSMEEDEAFFRDLCFTAPEMADAIAPEMAAHGAEVEEHVRRVYRAGQGEGPLEAIMRADVGFYMTEDVLVKVDRMSMAHGLEVRSPLLSKNVVELALSVPAELRLANGISKALLRKLAARYLPMENLHLPKKGFAMPVDRWFRGELRSVFEEEVLEDSSGDLDWVDRRTVRKLWDAHQSGAYRYGATFWALWLAREWRRALRSPVPEPAEELTVVG